MNKEETIKKAKASAYYVSAFVKWTFFSLIMGSIGGGVGALFSHLISYVTKVRTENEWLIYLLPLGGVAIALLYHLLKVEHKGTNDVFEAVRSEEKVPYRLAPAIAIGAGITHLLGGSAGKEGAALQLGGSVATLVGRIFRTDEKDRHILTVSGMAAVFAAVFGTPVGASVFAVEVASVGYVSLSALYPSFSSALISYLIALKLGVHPERFNVDVIPEVSAVSLSKAALLAVAVALVSIVFCVAMKVSHNGFEKYIRSPYIRAFVGGVAIILLTLIVGTRDYNGGGMHIIEGIFHGEEVSKIAFLMKIIFTAITIGSGFRGGEIVPTLFIGATLGFSLSGIIGLPVGFCAAVCMIALFAGVTNCPIASVFLAIELFGAEGMIFYALAVFVSFVLSGYFSLYTGQKIVFSKIKEEARE
ncbi:MAG: chloride channel protein [Clostridia bacterium]|nr:chloride channel protein [Clostridia bacterium]